MKKLLLLFTAILTVFLFASLVYATDIRLSSRCTLADAIIAANSDRAEGDCPAGRGADTITLTTDITLDDGLPKITSDITIEGNGYTISGDNRWRMFYNDGGALTIKDLTMTKGRVEVGFIRGVIRRVSEVIQTAHAHLTNTDERLISLPSKTFGGAIYNDEGTLNISDSAFSGNSADTGGAIYNRGGTVSISDSSFSGNLAGWGGAISDYGELSMVNSSFSHNSANWGGAIYNWEELSISDSAFSHNSAELSGGAINNLGELSIVNSSFSHNSAELSGAINNLGELSIVNSSFNHNSADRSGGAIDNGGELSIVNSTFSGNSADTGGAISNWVNELSVSNSAFSGNSADTGGAIFNWEELSLINSIIAGNGGDTCYSRVELKQNINNLVQDGSCSPVFRGDPKLGALVVPEDGSPAYFPLLVGSPAIDAADDDYCPSTDQIGTERPQGAGCDIGAFEYVAES